MNETVENYHTNLKLQQTLGIDLDLFTITRKEMFEKYNSLYFNRPEFEEELEKFRKITSTNLLDLNQQKASWACAKDLHKKLTDKKRLTTMSKDIDDMLGGGILPGTITEIVGESGAGKTQFAFQLAVNITLASEKGGLGKETLWIDADGAFRPKRIIQIANALELDPNVVLKKIIVGRAFNYEMLINLVKRGFCLKDVGLVVIDTFISNLWHEFSRPDLNMEFHILLSKFLEYINIHATLNDYVVVLLNRVIPHYSYFFGDPFRPIGNNTVGHGATTRIRLRKSKGAKRTATLTKSPELHRQKVEFRIDERGIRDYCGNVQSNSSLSQDIDIFD